MSECYNIYAKRIKSNPIASFKAKYKIADNGCWEWQASLAKSGYGQLFLSVGKIITAHRFSYQLYIGEIPNGLFVCHKCDNRKCCNPFHLFLGTNQDNMRDASNKGRLTNAVHPSVYHYVEKKCRCIDCVETYRAYRKRQKISSKSNDNNATVNNADTVNVKK